MPLVLSCQNLSFSFPCTCFSFSIHVLPVNFGDFFFAARDIWNLVTRWIIMWSTGNASAAVLLSLPLIPVDWTLKSWEVLLLYMISSYTTWIRSREGKHAGFIGQSHVAQILLMQNPCTYCSHLGKQGPAKRTEHI